MAIVHVGCSSCSELGRKILAVVSVGCCGNILIFNGFSGGGDVAAPDRVVQVRVSSYCKFCPIKKGPSADRGDCVVFLGKTLHSHSSSLSPPRSIEMDINNNILGGGGRG